MVRGYVKIKTQKVGFINSINAYDWRYDGIVGCVYGDNADDDNWNRFGIAACGRVRDDG